MKLHVDYDGMDRPEILPFERMIPAASAVPHEEIRQSIEKYEQARAAEREVRQVVYRAEKHLDDADHLDAVALADALERAGRDPGAAHHKKALAALDDARRQHAASRVALQRAVTGVREAFEEYGDQFESQERERGVKVGNEMLGAIDHLAELFDNARCVKSNLGIGQGGSLLRPAAYLSQVKTPFGLMRVDVLLNMLRELVDPGEPTPQPVYAHRRHPGQSLREREYQDRRHPGQTLVPLDPEAHAGKVRAAEEAQRQAAQAAQADRQAWRDERLARAEERRAQREALRQAEDEAIEAVA